MALVEYSDSEGSESESATKHTRDQPVQAKTLKRRRSSEEPSSDLPSLPDSFHDLYASTTRPSQRDDPRLHAGRQRQIPHVEGQWPTHVYLEWHPSRSETDALSNLLSRAHSTLPPDIRLHSLLESDLGAELPLHISLSRTLMLATHQRQAFTDDLEKAIGASGVKPFTIGLARLRWVSNYEHNRWFLVVQTEKPPGDELNKLLRPSNRVARSFEQPHLYTRQESLTATSPMDRKKGQSRFSRGKRAGLLGAKSQLSSQSSTMDEDASDHFHISIGWTLEKPYEDSSDAADVGIDEQVMLKLSVAVRTVKVKVGNGIVAIPLWAKTVQSNGIAGT
ncbi:MAG: hypothetical protein Q9193_001755 [Seirophora villosa]